MKSIYTQVFRGFIAYNHNTAQWAERPVGSGPLLCSDRWKRPLTMPGTADEQTCHLTKQPVSVSPSSPTLPLKSANSDPSFHSNPSFCSLANLVTLELRENLLKSLPTWVSSLHCKMPPFFLILKCQVRGFNCAPYWQILSLGKKGRNNGCSGAGLRAFRAYVATRARMTCHFYAVLRCVVVWHPAHAFLFQLALFPGKTGTAGSGQQWTGRFGKSRQFLPINLLFPVITKKPIFYFPAGHPWCPPQSEGTLAWPKSVIYITSSEIVILNKLIMILNSEN